MYKKSLCVVILAAGNSSRFGANKLLYPINNIPNVPNKGITVKAAINNPPFYCYNRNTNN